MSKSEREVATVVRIKQEIVDLVNLKPGIKAVELITQLSVTIHKRGLCIKDDIIDILLEMVVLAEISEIEYTLPHSSRVKAMYFPAGTFVYIKTKDMKNGKQHQDKGKADKKKS